MTREEAQAIVEQHRHPDGTPHCPVCNEPHPVDSMVRHCLQHPKGDATHDHPHQ